MEEEFSKLYKEYLDGMLDLVFNEKTGKKVHNLHYSFSKDPQIDIVKLGYECVYYDEEHEIIIIMKVDSRYFNALDKNGNLVFDKWYYPKYREFQFIDGYALVDTDDGKYNFIDINGNPIRQEGFDDAFKFCEGFALVKEYEKYNFIDTNGNYISEEWFDDAFSFHDGYARVKIDGKVYFIDKTGHRTFGEGYYKHNPYLPYENITSEYIVSDVFEGYAIVCLNDKYNYIDVKGNLLSTEWFKEAKPFSEGLARVKRNQNGEYAFINKSGIIESDKWRLPNDVNFTGDFHDGLATITINGYENYVNQSGRILVQEVGDNKGFYTASDFHNGVAAVSFYEERSRIWSTAAFIDTKGNYYICDSSDIRSLGEGFLAVGHCGYIHIVDKEGKYISNLIFDEVWDFKNGFATVLKDKILFRIDTKGNITPLSVIKKGTIKKYPCFLSVNRHSYIGCYYLEDDDININDYFQTLEVIYPGIIMVGDNHNYTLFFSDTHSFLNNKCVFTKILFSGDIAILQNEEETYFMNLATRKINKINPNSLISHNIDSIEHYDNGYAIVCDCKDDESYYNIIDKNGNFLLEWQKEYEYEQIKNGYVLCSVWGKQNGAVMDLQGNFVVPFKPHRECKLTNNFIIVNHSTVIPTSVDLGGLKLSKNIIGYQLSKDDVTIKLKYKPIKNYDNKFIICLVGNRLELFDVKANSYEELGRCNQVEYDDNFIYINELNHDFVYLMIDGKKIEIKEYYEKNLQSKKELFITNNIEILDPDIVYSENEDFLREKLRKAKEEIQKQEEELKHKNHQEELELVKKQDEKNIRMREIRKLEAVRNLTESVRILDELAMDVAIPDKDRIMPSRLLIKTNNHFEINPYYLEIKVLKYLNLSGTSFKNVKLSGIDFRGCNISFNPQEVYNKDLSNCNFEGISFPVSTNFTDVNICGTKFTNDGRATTFDINEESLSKGIYDENTTLNGIPLTELIKKDSAKK